MEIILSTAYAAPIEYYTLLASANIVSIEKYEHFIKQSYRNRCYIYGANGILALIIPLANRKDKTLTKDIRIANQTNWQKTHWKSIESAYRTSPFYEYFSDDIAHFYEQKFTFLIDFNQSIQQRLLDFAKIESSIRHSENYTAQYDKNVYDYRTSLSPKITTKIAFKNYSQVFDSKFGFIPNLSFFDLLFNEGNKSKEYLLNSLTFE